LLNGGLGSIPLTLLSDDAVGNLGEWVHRIDERIKAEKVTAPVRNMLMASGYILLGMRYNDDVIEAAYEGIHDMEESTTYQLILRKGRQQGELNGELKGRLETLREEIIDLLRERFGVVPESLEAEVRTSADVAKLKLAMRSIVKISSLDEFQL
jgi:hypothetical protein